MRIGENLKRIRTEKGIARSRLAAALRVDERLIADIEERGVQPQVSELLKLAAALGTDIAALIYGKEFREKKAIVTRPADRVHVERARYLQYESLAPYYSGRHVEPFIVRVQRRETEEPEFSRHRGEEFHYVLEGTLRITIENEQHILEPGDSIYFDSSLSHAVSAVTDSVTMLAALYYGESMLQMARGSHMRDIIQAAKLAGGLNIAVACPDETSVDAVRTAIEENIIRRAYLCGDPRLIPRACLDQPDRYEIVKIEDGADGGGDYASRVVARAVSLVREGECQMIMKGRVNTAVYVKGILDGKRGIGTDRRLSLVSIFELPNVDRLVFLTDPGINPALLPGDDIQASIDIINNGIDVARAMGVARPKVALLDANEVPSPKIPSTMYEKRLSEMCWEDAVVDGPISYDLALYAESARKKGTSRSPVTGQADVLVVPYISAGNFLYKAWAMTMDAEVANVVIGARAPVILTSRSDSDMVKFLTICASAIYSRYLTKSRQ